MKKRNSNVEVSTIQSGDKCCAPTTLSTDQVKVTGNNDCCEKPVDNSACCDKNETKEVNSQKTGCC